MASASSGELDLVTVRTTKARKEGAGNAIYSAPLRSSPKIAQLIRLATISKKIVVRSRASMDWYVLRDVQLQSFDVLIEVRVPGFNAGAEGGAPGAGGVYRSAAFTQNCFLSEG